jgi:hypothetical protein
MTRNRVRWFCLAAAGALLSLSPVAVFAQAGESESGEISGLGGVSFGAGTHAAVTGSTGIKFSRYGMALFDVSYLPLGNHTIQGWPASSTVSHSYLLDFGLDFHVRIPVKERWEPYGIVGAGCLWNLVRQNGITPAGAPTTYHFDQLNGAFHTGGGLRYFIRQNWGVRSEVKVVVSKQIYTEIMTGFFFVVPAEWP